MTWVRRNIIALWDGQPYNDADERENNWAECDRIFIALHRFQTEGKVAYRRLLGMHGGGGGTGEEKFRDILTDKVEKDVISHTGYGGSFPDGGYWPNPVPNAPSPTLIDVSDKNRCFAYTFCWHAEPEFIVWHRPIMAEFEYLLQGYDPKYNDDEQRHGKDALGAPYWGWEGWDGLTLPKVVDNQFYVIKTNRWKDSGFPKGSTIPNPYHRWYAPVSLKDQVAEYFPDTLRENNTTKRAAAFHDIEAEFDYPWEQVSAPANPSMENVVADAMTNKNFLHFGTMNHNVGGQYSIENVHNKFHNHVGGLIMGGIQGAGEQMFAPKLPFTGTMAQNQSIFDPIFWLHHSNVERQLCSWQKAFLESDNIDPLSKPSDTLKKRVLYPWTKPSLLWQGNLSHNTESSEENDATFEDWWDHKNLPYEYDEYLPSGAPAPRFGKQAEQHLTSLRIKVYVDASDYTAGDYALFWKEKLLGKVSVLSGTGGVCAHCQSQGDERVVGYKVTGPFDTVGDAEAAVPLLVLKRNGVAIQVKSVAVEKWN